MANFKDTETMDEINKAIEKNARYIDGFGWVNVDDMEDIINDLKVKVVNLERENKELEKSITTLLKAVFKWI